jgi:hypothetical protein
MARWPSGKAKVCKTFIGGSIPPRASNPKSMLLKQLTLQTSVEQEAQKSEQRHRIGRSGSTSSVIFASTFRTGLGESG